MVVLLFSTVGTNISIDDPVPRALLLLGGFSLQWFSLLDIMDGNRARRLKCGSPLGRLIDEGGDTITQANYSILMAFAW